MGSPGIGCPRPVPAPPVPEPGGRRLGRLLQPGCAAGRVAEGSEPAPAAGAPPGSVLLLGGAAGGSVFPLQLLEVASVEPRPREVPEDLGVLGLPQHQRAHASRDAVQVGRGGRAILLIR